MIDLRRVRIAIPREMPCEEHRALSVFNVLEKNSGLTEEFIYNTESTKETDVLPVFTASYDPIGFIPRKATMNGSPLKKCEGEVIIIFRQGYTGRMYIPEQKEFFASEHTIPIQVKPEFKTRLNQRWFIRYYEPEIRRWVTGKADSGNFSVLALEKLRILMPPKPWQDECARQYAEADALMEEHESDLEQLRFNMSIFGKDELAK